MLRLISMLAAALAASGAAAAPMGDPVRGEAIYQACTDCHSLDQNDVGPRHRGVYGRAAGSLPDYGYSDALKHAKIRLDRGDARQVADRSAGLRSGGEDGLPPRQPAGPRRRDRVLEGAGEMTSGAGPPSPRSGEGVAEGDGWGVESRDATKTVRGDGLARQFLDQQPPDLGPSCRPVPAAPL